MLPIVSEILRMGSKNIYEFFFLRKNGVCVCERVYGIVMRQGLKNSFKPLEPFDDENA